MSRPAICRIGRDRIEKDPDQRVQDALRLVFAKFSELHSVRQVHVWLRDEGIALPVASHSAADGHVSSGDCRSTTPCTIS